MDTLSYSFPNLILLNKNTALRENQIKASKETAYKGVHIDKKITVQICKFTRHDSLNIVAIIIIHPINR